MPQPIPPYLLALAVGDLASRELGPRSRVWAEPSVVEAAAWEFEGVDGMIRAAEKLFGPYEWDRFDILTMPGTSGTQLIEQLHQRHPALPILILSMHDEPATVRRALQAGATGYITKESSPETLHAAVRQVVAGERFIPPSLAETLAFESVRATSLAHETLSQRERQIFKLIAQGEMLSQIAEQLHLSPKTVTTHKTHLMEKLGTGNNAELIRYAIEHKLFD